MWVSPEALFYWKSLKNVLMGGFLPSPHTLPVLRVVLLHTELKVRRLFGGTVYYMYNLDWPIFTNFENLFCEFLLLDIGTWVHMVELNLGTNQIAKLPDDVACLQNLEVCLIFDRNMIFQHSRVQTKEVSYDKITCSCNFKVFQLF